MEKYGYKNISHRNEFEQNTEKLGKHQFSYNSGKYITHYNFINWGDQQKSGMPGQSNYTVKTLDVLLNAGAIVSGQDIKKK